MDEHSTIKVDLILIDRTEKNKIDLRPWMLLRRRDGGPAIAIVNNKLEDFCGSQSGSFEHSMLLIDGTE